MLVSGVHGHSGHCHSPCCRPARPPGGSPPLGSTAEGGRECRRTFQDWLDRPWTGEPGGAGRISRFWRLRGPSSRRWQTRCLGRGPSSPYSLMDMSLTSLLTRALISPWGAPPSDPSPPKASAPNSTLGVRLPRMNLGDGHKHSAPGSDRDRGVDVLSQSTVARSRQDHGQSSLRVHHHHPCL